MLLLIDIGNTNITIGLYEKKIKNTWRLNTADIGRSAGFSKGVIRRLSDGKIDGAVICSVVPDVTAVFVDAIRKAFGIKPLIVSHKLRTGLKFRIKRPSALGADRIANAVAAHRLYKGNLVIIDFGTATTVCALRGSGEYIGGVIMPGVEISAQALHEKTAKLPRVKLNTPAKLIGDDTRSNILSGLIFGHAGAVERIIEDIRRDIFKKVNTVIATGGLANLMAPNVKDIKEINPYLTLEGLRFIYELNT